MKRHIDNQEGLSDISSVDFQWDDRKNTANIAKHGVSFALAEKAFDDPNAVVAFDQDHSGPDELRWWLLGKVDGRVMLVRYTHRPNASIRILGAGFWRIGKEIYHEKAQRKV